MKTCLIWISVLWMFLVKSTCSSLTSLHATNGEFKSLRKYVSQLEHDVRDLTSRLKNTEQRLEVIEHSACVKFCNVSGTIYIHGANFTSGCDVCSCSFGRLECKPKQCPQTKCKHPDLTPGECCAKCKRKCFFEKEIYEHGDEIKRNNSRKKCISCVCNDGIMKCNDNSTKCPKLNCPVEQQLPVDDNNCCNYCPGTDFCAQNQDCDRNAVCNNLRTKFQCTCNAGFRGNGTFCEDVNECFVKGGSNGNFCNHNTHCENTVGSYKCACLSGFKRKDSFNCIDIDECKTGTHKCDGNSICVNTVGGHQCKCLPGFKLLNGECKASCDDCCRHEGKLFINGKFVANSTFCSHCDCENENIIQNSVICAQASVVSGADRLFQRINICAVLVLSVLLHLVRKGK